MKPAKTYPYRGEMITIKEAAQRAHVTAEAMRIRLGKCGGNMVRAIEGGGGSLGEADC